MSATRKSSGRSSNVRSRSRSTACTITSRARSHGISVAGTSLPCAVRTSRDHCCADRASIAAARSAGRLRNPSRAARPVAVQRRSRCRRCAARARSTSGSRRQCWPSAPGCSNASAFAATWATRCRPVHPGSAVGPDDRLVVDARNALEEQGRPFVHPASTRVERALGHQAEEPATTVFSQRPRPAISVTSRCPTCK